MRRAHQPDRLRQVDLSLGADALAECEKRFAVVQVDDRARLRVFVVRRLDVAAGVRQVGPSAAGFHSRVPERVPLAPARSWSRAGSAPSSAFFACIVAVLLLRSIRRNRVRVRCACRLQLLCAEPAERLTADRVFSHTNATMPSPAVAIDDERLEPRSSCRRITRVYVLDTSRAARSSTNETTPSSTATSSLHRFAEVHRHDRGRTRRERLHSFEERVIVMAAASSVVPIFVPSLCVWSFTNDGDTNLYCFLSPRRPFGSTRLRPRAPRRSHAIPTASSSRQQRRRRASSGP